MEVDLNFRSSRLERDQQKRRDEAKRKLYREKKLQEEQSIREKQLAELARLKRLEEQRLEEEKQARELLDYQETGGIHVSAMGLKFYEIEGADDKIILPETMLHELIAQDASSQGPMHFRLSVSLYDENNRITSHPVVITHAGVREFTAPSGHIGLTRKIIDSALGEHPNHSIESVTVKYVRLQKCTYAKLRPKKNDFFSVGPVKMCLEENLQLHTTISVGDVITVWYRGKSHVLTVVDTKPDLAGSLIDSDVEIDLDLSDEFLSKSSQTSEFEPNQANPTPSVAAKESFNSIPIGVDRQRHGFRLNDSTLSTRNTEMEIDEPAISAVSTSMDFVLPPEPEGTLWTDIVTVKVKLPGNGTLSRRFMKSDSIKSLFYFVSQSMKTSVMKLQLSQRFPARTFTFETVDAENTTFESMGASTQELLIASLR